MEGEKNNSVGMSKISFVQARVSRVMHERV